MRETAGAKVNLCLEVTGKLPDGYHGVRGIMQSLEFGDTVELEPGTAHGRSGPASPISPVTGITWLPGLRSCSVGSPALARKAA